MMRLGSCSARSAFAVANSGLSMACRSGQNSSSFALRTRKTLCTSRKRPTKLSTTTSVSSRSTSLPRCTATEPSHGSTEKDVREQVFDAESESSNGIHAETTRINGQDVVKQRREKDHTQNGVDEWQSHFDDTPPPLPPSLDEGFRVLEQRLLYKRYQTVTERLVEYPTGKTVSFDVLGLGACMSVFVFPVIANTGTTTLIREYGPGPHRIMHGFPAGLCEIGQKHATLEEAARAELSEEARLQAGRLIRLTGEQGIAADKYSRNWFHFYLALDCVEDGDPGELDDEEWIEIVPDVPLKDVRKVLASGGMNTPNSLLATLALDTLEQMGMDTR